MPLLWQKGQVRPGSHTRWIWWPMLFQSHVLGEDPQPCPSLLWKCYVRSTLLQTIVRGTLLLELDLPGKVCY